MTSKGRGILSPVRLPVPPLRRSDADDFEYSSVRSVFAQKTRIGFGAWEENRGQAALSTRQGICFRSLRIHLAWDSEASPRFCGDRGSVTLAEFADDFGGAVVEHGGFVAA